MNPVLEFIFKKKGTLPLLPFFRLVKQSAELGLYVGQELRASSEEQWARGVYNPFGAADLASPEILKYESSALGSSRLI
tara:strand:- start:315 stop:551 length:237 start_codon:yes stop_codon:yes gene_type:complete